MKSFVEMINNPYQHPAWDAIANGESLKPMRELIKKECGVDPEDTRFVIVGCEDVPGFEAVANCDRVDVDSVLRILWHAGVVQHAPWQRHGSVRRKYAPLS